MALVRLKAEVRQMLGYSFQMAQNSTRFPHFLPYLFFLAMSLVHQGRDGRVVYREMVSLFWTDVEYRLNNMAIDDRKLIRESTRELFSTFYGLVCAYDEVCKELRESRAS